MVALANLYTILDVSFQQLAVGLAILPSLVALTWYVSHPAHRRQLSAASCRPGARARLRSDRRRRYPLGLNLPLCCHKNAAQAAMSFAGGVTG